LFNYVDATELDTACFNQEGSVLAPYANAHLHSSAIAGSAVFGGNVVTEMGFEFHNFPFRGRVCIDGSTPGAGAGGADPTGGGASASALQRADFVVTEIALVNPPSVAGEAFGVKVTVANHGEIAGDAGRLDVYVSQPVSVAAGTVGDASVMVGVLQPGASRTFEFENLNSDTRSGTHHCRAFVNSEETTAEWSYGNNQMSMTYQVSAIILSICLTSNSVQVSWNSFWGQKYSLYRRASPVGPFTLIQEHIDASPPTNIVHDAVQPGMAFYHLSVEP
ncbi:MAG: choice-of-anchor A family protein, partial [Kiritimatiellia bacterium]